jgi:hypothetical protein
MVDTMFCFFTGNKSSPESAFVESATAWFKTSAAGWPVEPASGFLWYCHLLFLVKPPTPAGEQFSFL